MYVCAAYLSAYEVGQLNVSILRKTDAADMERHAHWNLAANRALVAAGVPILHVWRSASAAWDGHPDRGDCTHFCQPGVPDLWAQSFLSLAICEAHNGYTPEPCPPWYN